MEVKKLDTLLVHTASPRADVWCLEGCQTAAHSVYVDSSGKGQHLQPQQLLSPFMIPSFHHPYTKGSHGLGAV
jgi:hypothetical protein